MIPHLTATLAALGKYFAVRFRLLAAESKEAFLVYAVVVGLAIGAAFILFLGYVFLLIVTLFAIADACDSRLAWIWITFGAALFHLGLAAALGYAAYTRISRPLFPETLAELHHDSQWLQTLTKTP